MTHSPASLIEIGAAALPGGVQYLLCHPQGGPHVQMVLQTVQRLHRMDDRSLKLPMLWDLRSLCFKIGGQPGCQALISAICSMLPDSHQRAACLLPSDLAQGVVDLMRHFGAQQRPAAEGGLVVTCDRLAALDWLRGGTGLGLVRREQAASQR